MRKAGILFTFLILVGCLTSCTLFKDTKNKQMINLENTNWELIKVRDRAYVSNKFQPEGISISFSALYFSTSDGCNAIGGEYKISENTISFTNVRGTLRMCDDETMKHTYSVEFHNVKKFKVSKNKLYLYDSEGTTVLAEYLKK